MIDSWGIESGGCVDGISIYVNGGHGLSQHNIRN